MRTRNQIAQIIYNSLSDSKWSKLRDAVNGAELIALATEVVYNYEQRFRGTSLSRSSRTRDEVRASVESLIPNSVPRGAVYDALILWGTECVYQCEQAIIKDYNDTNWKTATSYAALLNLASQRGNQFPVPSLNPAYIIVQLPAGSTTYPPYSISIQAGSAIFYNITAYSSGDQATLFQGVPYSYNHSKDISTYNPCTDYDTTIVTNDITTENKYFSRYVKLPSTTLPYSVRFFTEGGELERWTALKSENTDTFKLYNHADGGLAVHISDNSSWGQDFVSDSADWNIRFLDCTDIEFEESSINLPEGYIFLASHAAVKDDLEYARNSYVRYMLTSSTSTYNEEVLRLMCLSFPGVQDCSLSTTDGYNYNVYVKPVRESNNIIFTELEDFLNDNLFSMNFITYCADYVQCMFIIKADISLSLKSQIEAYLGEKYSFTNMKFADTIDSGIVRNDIDQKFHVSTYDPDFSVSIRIKHQISRSSWYDDLKTGRSYVAGSMCIYTPEGEQVGWDDATTHRIYCAPEDPSSDVSISPSFILASNAAPKTVASSGAAYDFRSRSFKESGGWDSWLLHSKIFLGGNCAYAVHDNGNGGYLYIYPLNEDFFKNPCVSFNPTHPSYSYQIDSQLMDKLVASINRSQLSTNLDFRLYGVPVVAWDGSNTAYFFNQDRIERSTIYVLDLTNSEQTLGNVKQRVVLTSSYITSFNYFNKQVYIGTNDGTVMMLSQLSSVGWSSSDYRYCRSFRLQDSFGNPFVDLSNVTWNFPDAPQFSFYISSTGEVQLVVIDTDPPVVQKPSGWPDTNQLIDWSGSASERPPYVDTCLWTYLDDYQKTLICTKWRVYSASRFKVTAKGLELINLNQVAHIPSFQGHYFAKMASRSTGQNHEFYLWKWGSTNVLATLPGGYSFDMPAFGPVITAGVNGSVFAYGQLYYRCFSQSSYVIRFSNHNLAPYGVWVKDTTTGYISVPKVVNPYNRHDSAYIRFQDNPITLPIKAYDANDYAGVYTYGPSQPASVVLNSGGPLGKTFVVEMPRASSMDDRYVKLDDNYVVWVS